MRQRLTAKAQLPVVDLTELLKPYHSGWVAITPDNQRVVGAGATLQEAKDQAMERGVPNAMFEKIIPPDQGYIG